MGLESLWEEGWDLMQGRAGHLAAQEAPDQAPPREGLNVRAGRNLGEYPVQPLHFTDGKSEGMCLALSLTGG